MLVTCTEHDRRYAANVLGVDPGECAAKAVLVGESLPRAHSGSALFPYPRNAAGHRLAKMAGMSDGEYLRTFARRNVVDDAPGDGSWPAGRAAVRAESLIGELLGQTRRVYLLGRRVWQAFGFDAPEPFSRAVRQPAGDVDGVTYAARWVTIPHNWRDAEAQQWVLLPHPSGKNHDFNDPANRARAQALLREAVTE